MEIRARYLLIGLFVLAVIAGGFGFVFWLNTTGGLGPRTTYRVAFDAPVSGLLNGSAVLFNGLKVGEVTEIEIDPANPHGVAALIAIDSRVPVRSDTAAGLEFRGLTGVASITLVGGAADAPPLAATPGQPPTLVANPASSQDVMAAARQALQHLDQILTDNAASLKSAISNIDTFSQALARNSDKIDKIADGLAQMVGTKKEEPHGNFDLSAPATFAAPAAMPDSTLAVADPTAEVVFDGQRLLLTKGGETNPDFESLRWADSLPVVIQATIIKSFENAGYLKATKPIEGMAADHTLRLDIQDFSIGADADPAVANVVLSAKILDNNQAIKAAKVFKASVPLKDMDAKTAAGALNDAFGKVAVALVNWTLEQI
jgi:phospholipid/cholesterol/gamma-HCH transport system substrate-binding protein